MDLGFCLAGGHARKPSLLGGDSGLALSYHESYGLLGVERSEGRTGIGGSVYINLVSPLFFFSFSFGKYVMTILSYVQTCSNYFKLNCWVVIRRGK